MVYRHAFEGRVFKHMELIGKPVLKKDPPHMDTILVPRARETPDKKQKYLIFGRPFHRMLDARC